MPLFIDRHFIEHLTDEIASEAHAADLKVAPKYGVKFITFWYDKSRGTNFCLVEAPDKETIIRAHDEAHGDIPSEIIEVDPSIVESFLGRMQDPEPDQDNKRHYDSAFRGVMFTDLKDSTLMNSTYGDKKALHLLHVTNTITRNALRANQGTEVKHTGDGIMASFSDITSAIRCAREIQQGFKKYNADNPEEPLYLRIGLSAGEPIEEHGDLFGTVVQLAARLCAHAEPNQILISDVVKRECTDSTHVFIDRGSFQPKGFTKEVSIFEVEV